MSKRQKVNESMVTTMVGLNTIGKSFSEIAETLDVSPCTVGRYLTCYHCLMQGDEKKLITLLEQNRVSFAPAITTVSRAIGKEISEPVQNKINEKVPEPAKKEPKNIEKNEELYLCKVLECLTETNELLTQLMDVVIPKFAGDIKDNMNINGDLITERLKKNEAELQKISYNTRKRGI